jgi:hypothetical protein
VALRALLSVLRSGSLALFCAVAPCLAAQAQPTLFAEPGPSSDDALFSFDTRIGPIDYVSGRGLRLGRTGLHIGGFSSLEFDKQQGESGTLELDSLSFLVGWRPVEFFQAFTEVEIGKLLLYETGSDSVHSNPDAKFERLYADLTWDDALNLRVGKFQTPVGIWNLVPEEPFTWTANEPVLVETAFDEHQTGGAVFGTTYPGSGTLSYWVYGQFMGPLDPSQTPPPAQKSAGGRVSYGSSTGDWAIGSSFLASQVDGGWSYLGGLDGFWQVGPVELQTEWAIVRGEPSQRNLWSIYTQGVYNLGYHSEWLRSLNVVGRYEYFDPLHGERGSNIGNVGLAWLPARFLVLKAGYQFTDHQTALVARGLFTSFSILF